MEQGGASAVLFISLNWRGRPLTSYQVIIDLITSTTTSTGLKVYARLDPAVYAKVKVTKEQSLPSTSPEATGTPSGTTASLPATTHRNQIHSY